MAKSTRIFPGKLFDEPAWGFKCVEGVCYPSHINDIISDEMIWHMHGHYCVVTEHNVRFYKFLPEEFVVTEAGIRWGTK